MYTAIVDDSSSKVCITFCDTIRQYALDRTSSVTVGYKLTMANYNQQANFKRDFEVPIEYPAH